MACCVTLGHSLPFSGPHMPLSPTKGPNWKPEQMMPQGQQEQGLGWWLWINPTLSPPGQG